MAVASAGDVTDTVVKGPGAGVKFTSGTTGLVDGSRIGTRGEDRAARPEGGSSRESDTPGARRARNPEDQTAATGSSAERARRVERLLVLRAASPRRNSVNEGRYAWQRLQRVGFGGLVTQIGALD